MTNDVIELLDESDNEHEAEISTLRTRSVRSIDDVGVVATDTIDLCESDSDMDSSMCGRTTSLRNSATRQHHTGSTANDSDDDDVLIVENPARMAASLSSSQRGHENSRNSSVGIYLEYIQEPELPTTTSSATTKISPSIKIVSGKSSKPSLSKLLQRLEDTNRLAAGTQKSNVPAGSMRRRKSPPTYTDSTTKLPPPYSRTSTTIAHNPYKKSPKTSKTTPPTYTDSAPKPPPPYSQASSTSSHNPYRKSPNASMTSHTSYPTTPASPQSYTNSSDTPRMITNPYAKKGTKPLRSSHHASAPPHSLASQEKDSDSSASDSDWKDLLRGPSIFSSKAAKKPPPVEQRTSSLKDIIVASSCNRKRPSAVALPPSAATSSSSSGGIQSFPILLDSSKTYPDLRAQFALSLWKFARLSCTTKAYQRQRLDQLMKKVVLLALSEFPIRSLHELVTAFSSSRSISVNVRQSKHQLEQLQEQLQAGGFVESWILATTPPASSQHGQGLFYTIAEACLVVLWEHVQIHIQPQESGSRGTTTTKTLLKERESWMSLNHLIVAIDGRLRPECPAKLVRSQDADHGEAYYLDLSTRSAEFLQIVKLESQLGDCATSGTTTPRSSCDVRTNVEELEEGPRIKRHRYKGQVYVELLQRGWKDAQRIRSRSFPAPKGHYRSSKLSMLDPKYDGICLGIDRKEGGGGFVLHEMCNKLDMQRVPYFCGTLAIGDYVFFTHKEPGQGSGGPLNFLCPILIERKSIQDVAQSIHDGRWQSQKSKMYHGQYIFGYDNCRMLYIIEGNAKQQQVSGGYYGSRHFYVDEKRLQDAIYGLEEEGFEVKRTPSRENTMFELARWAGSIAQDMRTSKLKAEYTYQQFKDKLKSIPPGTDFSRLAKYHMVQRKEAAAAAEDVAVLGLDSDIKMPPKKKMKFSAKEDNDEFQKCSITEMKQMCKSVGLSTSGTKEELIERYKGPRPPKVWLRRKDRKQFVPARHNVAGTALLVALYLHERATAGGDKKGLTKDEVYVKAEGLNITKNPFSGGTTQTGPYHYDGWSSMGPLLKGDPALVALDRKRYKLTRSCDLAGWSVAEAMHKWCHEHGNCPCGDED